MGRYHATTTLVRSATAPKDFTMSRAALYITGSDVPGRATSAMGYGGDPLTLASKLTVVSNDKIGSLTISYAGTDAIQVSNTVNAFAQALESYLKEADLQQQKLITDAIQVQLNALKTQLHDLDNQIAARGARLDSALIAERSATANRYSTLSKDLDQQATAAAQPAPVHTLELASATAVGASGLAVLNHTGARIAIAALIGLLLALALVYVLERFDTRLRDRNDVEEESGVPVLAEVPRFSKSGRTPCVEILRAPGSAAAETYRGLRASVLLAADSSQAGRGGRRSDTQRHPFVLLAASASAREGRTSTVVNLAACLAESGRSVLVLDCDFRNPQTHLYFDRPHGRGLSDLLAAELEGELDSLAGPTPVNGVRLVMSGTSGDQPAALLSRMGGLIAEARELADVVLIDAPPVLQSNDAIDLLPHVDGVVVVARLGRTTVSQALRTTDLLRRSGTTALGVVEISSSTRNQRASASAFGSRTAGSRRSLGEPYQDLDGLLHSVAPNLNGASPAHHAPVSHRIGGQQ